MVQKNKEQSSVRFYDTIYCVFWNNLESTKSAAVAQLLALIDSQ
jgi:hypothetical protein